MDELLQSVIEAATWIDKVNPQFEDNFYRSEELRPTGVVLNWKPGFQRQHFESVLRKRRQLLAQRGISLLRKEELLDQGRLILTYPIDTIYDGMPGIESHGYFDYYELPPWDTWVDLTHSNSALIPYPDYVVAWVPNAQLAGVLSGHRLSMMANVNWLHELRDESLSSDTLHQLFAEPTVFPEQVTLEVKEIEARLDYLDAHKLVVQKPY
jgi:hypothetical protein